MLTIHKFPLKVMPLQTFEMPANAIILSIDQQNNEIQMWAVVDTDLEPQLRSFVVVGTGRELRFSDDSFVRPYIGTVLMDNGYVWHVFEVKKKSIMPFAKELGEETP